MAAASRPRAPQHGVGVAAGGGGGAAHAARGRAELGGDPDLRHRAARAVRRGRLQDHVAGDVVGIGGGLRGRQHRRGADVGLVQQREPVIGGAGAEDRAQGVVQPDPGGGVVLVLQRDQVLPVDGGAEVGEELRLDGAQAEPAIVGGAVDVVVGRATVEHVAARREVRADGEVRRHGRRQQRQHAVRHRDVDVLPTPGRLPRDDGRARIAKAAIRPPPAKSASRLRGMAGRAGPSEPGALAAGGGERAGRRDVVDVVADVGRVGAGLPVAAQRAVDQARVAGRQGVVVDAQALDHAGAEALQHDVGLIGEAVEDLAGGVGLEVEGQRSLIAAQRGVGGGAAQGRLVARSVDALIGRRGDVARIVDHQHVGPHVAQQHRAVGPGGEPGEVEDAQPREGQRRLGRAYRREMGFVIGRPGTGVTRRLG